MPWRETSAVNERMHFIARLEAGERMVDLCREFGISRKTGYKIRDRHNSHGPVGLYDRSRKPLRSPNRTAEEIRELIFALRGRHPTWGAPKLKAALEQKHPGLKIPAVSTIGTLLKKAGLTQSRKRRRTATPSPTPLREVSEPNELWCADFKGQFRLQNGRYCYPLTITDQATRFVIACVALESVAFDGAHAVMVEAFERYGLPEAIRTDNGSPFASTGLVGLSRLSVCWLKQGVLHERIRPGHPEENGRHERMHLTLKQETTRPAGANFLQQQERFDEFREVFNYERPHEALGQVTPGSLYVPSPRLYTGDVPPHDYSLFDFTRSVGNGGAVAFHGLKRFFLTSTLRGERVGLREVEPGQWLVAWRHMELGTYDAREHYFEPMTFTEQARDSASTEEESSK